MSTQTTNLGLTKPAGNERPLVGVLNDNMDIIDDAIATLGGSVLQFKSYCTGDFNNLTTSGIYYNANGMTGNKPVSANMYGYVVVIAFNNQYTVQVAWTLGQLYWRAKYGAPASWSAWNTLTS